MEVQFFNVDIEGENDEGYLGYTKWEVVPRKGEFVGIFGKSWYVESVSYAAYIKDPNGDCCEPLERGPLVTVNLKVAPES